MSSTKFTLAAVGAFAATALAHGNVVSFSTDGKKQQGYLMDYYYQTKNGGEAPKVAAWSTENLDNGFVDPTMYKTSDINCHKKAKPGALTSSVKAGGEVSFEWPNWPHNIGPVLTYVADCGDDCSKVDPSALKWVKIDEAGYKDGKWGADKLVADNGVWTTKVPANLKAGNYVFRNEIIALHAGGQLNGCVNIAVTGSGTELPEGTLGTDLYDAKDPGILFNPYTTIKSYPIPGPKLFGAASTGGSSPAAPAASASAPAASKAPAASAPASSAAPAAPAPTQAAAEDDDDACEAEGDDDDEAEGEDDACEAEGDDEEDDEEDGEDGDDDSCEPEAPAASSAPAPAPAPVPTTMITRTSSAAPAPTAPTAGGDAGSSQGAALYGQCGGIGFTGPSTCAEGKCTKMNDWYSQCVN
ncbi:glycoside hydrolase [Apiospora aurea]|uniref:lytic cellulose monooxygenase (C4-dehydrogenating) n=1 Tax=Apiospora aurea TaxID=335848 RepID=A0ABR1QNV9_9PEZI